MKTANYYLNGQKTYAQIQNAIASEYYLNSTVSYQTRESLARLSGLTLTDTAIEHYQKAGHCNFY